MSRNKTFCLTCYESNMACKCSVEESNRFGYSYKLRVPKIKNKAKFRKFLDDCPIFINCVSDEQQEEFRKLLRFVKYYEKIINGKGWSYVRRGKSKRIITGVKRNSFSKIG